MILERNSLARFLLPTPKEDGEAGVAMLTTDAIHCIARLLKMSSPIKAPIFWANLSNPRTVLDELDMTNTQPLVLAGVGVDHLPWVRDLARQAAASSPRKLLIVAKPDVPLQGVERVDMTDLAARNPVDLTILPWEALGSIVLRAYMRREWDGHWFTREPVPGNETKLIRKEHTLNGNDTGPIK